jgi:hypothetical protein
MNAPKVERGSRSQAVMRGIGLLLWWALAFALCPGCATEHLASSTGKAFDRIMDLQTSATRGKPEELVEMSAEGAEIVMNNYRQGWKVSQNKSSGGQGLALLPIQR